MAASGISAPERPGLRPTPAQLLAVVLSVLLGAGLSSWRAQGFEGLPFAHLMPGGWLHLFIILAACCASATLLDFIALGFRLQTRTVAFMALTALSVALAVVFQILDSQRGVLDTVLMGLAFIGGLVAVGVMFTIHNHREEGRP